LPQADSSSAVANAAAAPSVVWLRIIILLLRGFSNQPPVINATVGWQVPRLILVAAGLGYASASWEKMMSPWKTTGKISFKSKGFR
jgi:hypothetical protein